MALIADVPEVARLLMLASQWRIALKRMTPVDVTAKLVEAVCKTAGVNISLAEMEKISNEMQAGAFPGKNVYEVMQSPEFQSRISETFSITAAPSLPPPPGMSDNEYEDILVSCRHCGALNAYPHPSIL